MFLRGKSAAPPVAAISSVAYGYLAIKLHNAPLSTEHPRGELYALAAALTLCIIPYTLLVMKNVNAKLMAKAEGMKNLDVKDEVTEVGLPKGESAKELLDWWGVVNLGRGVFPLLGAVVGIWTSLR
ncbi:hypothetical protein MMC08_001057 [Hypocenomyce scalaris]|nr:hypothetical protein [Hypocenomyce scalaris]